MSTPTERCGGISLTPYKDGSTKPISLDALDALSKELDDLEVLGQKAMTRGGITLPSKKRSTQDLRTRYP